MKDFWSKFKYKVRSRTTHFRMLTLDLLSVCFVQGYTVKVFAPCLHQPCFVIYLPKISLLHYNGVSGTTHAQCGCVYWPLHLLCFHMLNAALIFLFTSSCTFIIDQVYINLRFIDGKLKRFTFFNVKTSKMQGTSTR